jgi:hypothetical protein
MKIKNNTMRNLQDVYLTREQFDKDLETCLVIITYPSKKKPYYICHHLSASLERRIVNVYIKQQSNLHPVFEQALKAFMP